MTKEEIKEIAENTLSGIKNDFGGILTSSHLTIQPGSVYYLGFNPGGTGSCRLSVSIDGLLTYTENGFYDDEWGNFPKGKAPHQERARYIFSSLGLNPKDVCASNIIFKSSPTAKEINYGLANACWPVHDAILKIVKPKLIIACGNSLRISSYSFLLSQLDGIEDAEETLPKAEHGNWRMRGFWAKLDGKNIYTAGLPHLSRYNPKDKTNILNWLKDKLLANRKTE